MTDAQFIISYPGKVLDGAVISKFSASEEDCQYMCMEDDRCKSINIDEKGTKCDLNNKIAGDSETLLVTKAGWKHKTTNFSEKQVNVLHNNYTRTVLRIKKRTFRIYLRYSYSNGTNTEKHFLAPSKVRHGRIGLSNDFRNFLKATTSFICNVIYLQCLLFAIERLRNENEDNTKTRD